MKTKNKIQENAMPKKQFKISGKLIAVILLVLVLGGAYAYWNTQKQKGTQNVPATAVAAFKVLEREINPESSFVAKVESKDTVGLRARVTGFLQERLFQEGDLVAEGQPLFILEKINFEANVRDAEANVQKAEAHAENAKSQYERTKTLFKTKDVSEAKLDEALATYESAKADVEQMKARLDLARQDLIYTEIIAPMTGKIGESKFSVGELIGPESGVLATLVTIDPMDVVFSISENQLMSLQQQFDTAEEMDVTFYTSTGKAYGHKGQVSFVDVALDEAMNTLKFKASFPNPNNQLISGQYGRIVLKSLTPSNKILIPMRAVQRNLTDTYVYVITPEKTIEKRLIRTGMELDNFDVIVEEGLASGEEIVVEGFQKIAPGAKVTPVFENENPKGDA
jgi:membrane fusion protein (multidrug efflux system)